MIPEDNECHILRSENEGEWQETGEFISIDEMGNYFAMSPENFQDMIRFYQRQKCLGTTNE